MNLIDINEDDYMCFVMLSFIVNTWACLIDCHLN